eukprot:5018879-Pleurochrysis_carterae.AAC.2
MAKRAHIMRWTRVDGKERPAASGTAVCTPRLHLRRAQPLDVSRALLGLGDGALDLLLPLQRRLDALHRVRHRVLHRLSHLLRRALRLLGRAAPLGEGDLARQLGLPLARHLGRRRR